MNKKKYKCLFCDFSFTAEDIGTLPTNEIVKSLIEKYNSGRMEDLSKYEELKFTRLEPDREDLSSDEETKVIDSGVDKLEESHSSSSSD
mmetsp:Transcript_15168/g.17589  ORF Transcript_15168/g.17589 Transcript_15168/m.17589 type:complete len:89 (+) Transcript_15168:168-434(+)